MKTIRWPSTVREARKEQELLRKRVIIAPLERRPRLIAALDAAFSGDRVVGAACLYTYPKVELVEKVTAVLPCRFPYIPGYLTFREGPVLVAALGKLKTAPDLLLFDGQGIAHPRGMGIASHIGVLLDIPSVGCAKSRLTGTYREPGREKGKKSTLYLHEKGSGYRGMPVGTVLRTRADVRPVYVSPGHLVDIASSVRLVLAFTGRYRIPDPLRCADTISKKAAKML